MFRAANGDGAALSWQACQSHPRPLLAGIKRPLCLGVRRIRAVRGRGSVLHRTRPKCETRKKGARCAPDFAAKPPREQSSREGARADARRNEHSASGGADLSAPNAMRGCDEAPQSVLTHSVRSGTLRGPRSVLFSARTRERTTSYATEVRDTQKGRKVRP